MTVQTETREFTITRTFDAPIELVFAAWTEPEHMAGWYGPAELNTPVANISLDKRPGGHWEAGMEYPGSGVVCVTGGVYREIDPPNKLVFTCGWSMDGKTPAEECVVTVNLTEADGKTEMTFHQIGAFDSAAAESMHGGWTEAFEKFAAYVAKGPK